MQGVRAHKHTGPSFQASDNGSSISMYGKRVAVCNSCSWPCRVRDKSRPIISHAQRAAECCDARWRERIHLTALLPPAPFFIENCARGAAGSRFRAAAAAKRGRTCKCDHLHVVAIDDTAKHGISPEMGMPILPPLVVEVAFVGS